MLDNYRAIEAWKRDGKKYPIEAYRVTDCDCGCSERGEK
jgi:hypothetical protein